MYYPPHPNHWYHRSRPSRLLWFLIGAGFTLWWTKRHERGDFRLFNCTRHKLPPPPSQADSNGQNPAWPQNMSDIPRAINNIPSGNAPASPPPGSWPSKDGWRWDPDPEHMEKVSKQALDAMVDLTESTLESVMSTAASLRTKLAEHRAQREKQQRAFQAELEEQRKNPPPTV